MRSAGLPTAEELDRLLTLHKFKQSAFTTTVQGLLEVPDTAFHV